MSHFEAKMHRIRFRASVRSFVRPSVCLLDGVCTVIYGGSFDSKSATPVGGVWRRRVFAKTDEHEMRYATHWLPLVEGHISRCSSVRIRFFYATFNADSRFMWSRAREITRDIWKWKNFPRENFAWKIQNTHSFSCRNTACFKQNVIVQNICISVGTPNSIFYFNHSL